jgi:hypothetical protein
VRGLKGADRYDGRASGDALAEVRAVEGCGRGTEPHFLKSLRESAGEGNELHYQLGVAIELGYGDTRELQRLYEMEERFLRMHTRLQAVIRARIREKRLDRRPSLKRAKRASPQGAKHPPEQAAPPPPQQRAQRAPQRSPD